ncbi:MAG: hypothetical protein ACMUHU_05140 [Thermoplasmatota archaeon]
MRNGLLVSTFVLATILAFTPIFFIGATDDAEGQDPGQPMMLNNMKMFLSEGMEMTPLPPESSEWQAISIPNGFVRDGLFGYSILPIGHTYWRDVGMWSTQPLRETVNLGGEVRITIYATREAESGAVSSDFMFYIMRGTEILLQLSSMNQRIDDGVDNRIEAVGRFPSGNDTTIEAGTPLALMIQARCNGGAIMKYGSTDLDAGFTFGSNALQILNLFMDKEMITVEYKDAFMVPWIKLYTELKIDGVIHPNEQMMSEMNTFNRTREIIWERESTPANYEVFVSMSYHYSGTNNISMSKILRVHKPHVSTWDNVKSVISAAFIYAVLVAIAIVGIVLLVKLRRSTWRKRFRQLPAMTQELSVHKKKKEWKLMNKQRKRTKKQEKKEDRERRVETDDGEFSLFKRKDRPAPQRKTAVAINLGRETAEELEL